MNSILSVSLVVMFIISFTGSSLASLNTKGQPSLTTGEVKPELYCGLALPLDEGEGGEGETDNSEEEPKDGSESEPDSETRTEGQPGR